MSSVPGWVAPYIGLPWTDGGRDFSGVDCEGLCRIVMQHEAGDPSLPEYGVVSASGMLSVARAFNDGASLPPWVPVDRSSIRMFDWVLMTGRCKIAGRHRSIILHVGIMINDSLVLHIEEATHSVAVPLDHISIRNRLSGFVRHEILT